MKATARQKIAIKNLLSYIRTLNKHYHKCITKEENDIIENMSFQLASKQIANLIERTKEKDQELAWS